LNPMGRPHTAVRQPSGSFALSMATSKTGVWTTSSSATSAAGATGTESPGAKLRNGLFAFGTYPKA
jgi:hypothetical protein